MSAPTQVEMPVRQLPSLEGKSAAFDGNDSNSCVEDLHAHKRQGNMDYSASYQPKRAKREADGDPGSEPENGGSPKVVPSSNEGKDRALFLRKEFVAPGCIMFYPGDPLMIVRGEGQYLFDEHGRKYLDCVNNVCHVGHCHPRVVEAGVKQMQILNTNNRYLHSNIGNYAQHLRTKMPGDLSMFYFLNSGSEANDLALRLAREVTGGTEIIAIEGAYHGNLSSLMSISSYKWNGDNRWCGEHTILAPLPDVYRGKYRDPETAGQLYAEEVKELIDQAHSKGRKIAGFICESAMSSAGQVIFPKGYLQAVFKYVREAGGLCIADEVQVGFGRAGKHFWMFEEHGVLPDVVTIGKPMGNGHPVSGLVTTATIAKEHSTVAPSFFNTFGGNPVSMAVAEATLCVIEDEHLQEHAAEVGEFMLTGLKALKAKYPQVVGDVRGAGLFGCLELVKSSDSREPNKDLAVAIHETLMKQYRIIMTTDGLHTNVLKFKPPMVFSTEDAKYLCESLDAILKELSVVPSPDS